MDRKFIHRQFRDVRTEASLGHFREEDAKMSLHRLLMCALQITHYVNRGISLKEYVLALGIAGLALALAGCGGSPQAAPTVTITQTVTATQAVTAPAPTVTVTVTQTVAPVAAPAPVAPAVATAVLPADAAGQNAQALSDELEALGYKHVVWNSDTGNSVFLLSNWTVTSLEKAGESVPVSKTVVVHVTKPGQ